MTARIVVLFLLGLMGVLAADAGEPRWDIERVPEGGIQPRLAQDRHGNVHLLYFQFVNRETRRGHYAYRPRGESGGWSDPVRVTVDALAHNDAIGKAAFAVEDNGRIHVVWLQGDGYHYSRSIPGGAAFEPQRKIVTEHVEGIEAEAAIATRGKEVTIAWHAGDMADEASRQVYIVRSQDGGDHFGEETAISDASLGACACCTLATGYDGSGQFVFAYRSAINGTGRHLQLVRGTSVKSVGDWTLDTCPVSSNTIKANSLVFETKGQVMHASLLAAVPEPVAPGSSPVRQKHPDVAINSRGERMVVWGEANGYVKGGELRAQLFAVDDSRATQQPETQGMTIPDFSVAAATPLPNNRFLILY